MVRRACKWFHPEHQYRYQRKRVRYCHYHLMMKVRRRQLTRPTHKQLTRHILRQQHQVQQRSSIPHQFEQTKWDPIEQY
jgi:hypothetical protein